MRLQKNICNKTHKQDIWKNIKKQDRIWIKCNGGSRATMENKITYKQEVDLLLVALPKYFYRFQ